MKTLLVLARGDLKSFHTINGQSIFQDLPFKTVLLVDRGNQKQLAQLAGNLELVTVRWSDEDALKQTVAQLHQQHQFCGVATVDESNVSLAAELRAQLNLTGMQPAQAEWFRDKVKMKAQLQPFNIRVPLFCECQDKAQVTAILKQFGQIVIKPRAGFGSKQVTFVSHPQELDAWYQENSNEIQHYEAEEFIDDQLFHVNALVIDGQTRLSAAAAYLPGMSNVDFSAGTPFVSVIVEDEQLRNRLIAFSDQVNQAFELQNGVTHLECFVTEKQEIVFCEVGLRPGGGGIVWMIESQYGINYSQAVIALEANEAQLIAQPIDKPNNLSGLIGIRSNLSGFITQTAHNDDFSDEQIRLKHIAVDVGNFKAASAHCTDFLGLFIFDALNHAHFEQTWRSINEKFQEKLILNCI